MSTLNLRLPESLHRRLGEVAEQEGVSINQLISAAVGEKMAALLTEEYLAARAKKGTRGAFLAALTRVPDVEPAEEDRLLPRATKRVRTTAPRAGRRARR
ncbi:MAG: toxin-antitoxin system HicB family antitoxin [Deltaproteobacteria bacterium]|nr:toxin-antitoxin system HicB family antitoxin [Deltaproteobacteria bacterium]